MGHDVVGGFRGRAGRYLLAAFAVAVGIMAFALLVLIVGGLEGRVAEITRGFGADVVSIVREEPLSGPRRGLSMTQVDAIRAGYPALSVAPMKRYRAATAGPSVSIVATGPDWLAVRGGALVEGRNLDHADLRRGARVVVASHALAEQSGWRAGRIVLVDDTPFFVAGVLDAHAARLPGDESAGEVLGERFALMPWTAVSAWRGERGDEAERLSQVLVRGADPDRLVASLATLFAQPGLDAGRVGWVTAEALVAGIEQLKRTLVLGVGAVAALCLLLGGTTLMSLMVLNVRERLPEIGLRLSLGARRWQVSTLFVVEALLVTLLAGVVGTVLAHALAGLVGERAPVPLTPNLVSMLAPTVLAMALGAVFSWGPARLAARVTPAEAMRAD